MDEEPLDEPLIPGLDDVIWCENCQRLQQDVKKSQEEHVMNYLTLKQKIISTDLLIKKYKAKCDEHDSQVKISAEISKKLLHSERECHALNAQLKSALQDVEPLRKAQRTAEDERHAYQQQVEALQDKLQASEKLQHQYALLTQETTAEAMKSKDQQNEQLRTIASLKSNVKKSEDSFSRLKDENKKKRSELLEMKKSKLSLDKRLSKLLVQFDKYCKILAQHGLLPKGDKRSARYSESNQEEMGSSDDNEDIKDVLLDVLPSHEEKPHPMSMPDDISLMDVPLMDKSDSDINVKNEDEGSASDTPNIDDILAEWICPITVESLSPLPATPVNMQEDEDDMEDDDTAINVANGDSNFLPVPLVDLASKPSKNQPSPVKDLLPETIETDSHSASSVLSPVKFGQKDNSIKPLRKSPRIRAKSLSRQSASDIIDDIIKQHEDEYLKEDPNVNLFMSSLQLDIKPDEVAQNKNTQNNTLNESVGTEIVDDVYDDDDAVEDKYNRVTRRQSTKEFAITLSEASLSDDGTDDHDEKHKESLQKLSDIKPNLTEVKLPIHRKRISSASGSRLKLLDPLVEDDSCITEQVLECSDGDSITHDKSDKLDIDKCNIPNAITESSKDTDDELNKEKIAQSEVHGKSIASPPELFNSTVPIIKSSPTFDSQCALSEEGEMPALSFEITVHKTTNSKPMAQDLFGDLYLSDDSDDDNFETVSKEMFTSLSVPICGNSERTSPISANVTANGVIELPTLDQCSHVKIKDETKDIEKCDTSELENETKQNSDSLPSVGVNLSEEFNTANQSLQSHTGRSNDLGEQTIKFENNNFDKDNSRTFTIDEKNWKLTSPDGKSTLLERCEDQAGETVRPVTMSSVLEPIISPKRDNSVVPNTLSPRRVTRSLTKHIPLELFSASDSESETKVNEGKQKKAVRNLDLDSITSEQVSNLEIKSQNSTCLATKIDLSSANPNIKKDNEQLSIIDVEYKPDIEMIAKSGEIICDIVKLESEVSTEFGIIDDDNDNNEPFEIKHLNVIDIKDRACIECDSNDAEAEEIKSYFKDSKSKTIEASISRSIDKASVVAVCDGDIERSSNISSGIVTPSGFSHLSRNSDSISESSSDVATKYIESELFQSTSAVFRPIVMDEQSRSPTDFTSELLHRFSTDSRSPAVSSPPLIPFSQSPYNLPVSPVPMSMLLRFHLKHVTLLSPLPPSPELSKPLSSSPPPLLADEGFDIESCFAETDAKPEEKIIPEKPIVNTISKKPSQNTLHIRKPCSQTLPIRSLPLKHSNLAKTEKGKSSTLTRIADNADFNLTKTENLIGNKKRIARNTKLKSLDSVKSENLLNVVTENNANKDVEIETTVPNDRLKGIKARLQQAFMIDFVTTSGKSYVESGKAKRGRKPKNKNNNMNTVQEDVSVLKDVNSTNPHAEPVKRKRGRPRKNPISNMNTAQDDSSADVITANVDSKSPIESSTVRRGRKPKSKTMNDPIPGVDASDSATASPIECATAGRGRKRKSNPKQIDNNIPGLTNNYSSMESPIESAKIGRGRKRKSNETLFDSSHLQKSIARSGPSPLEFATVGTEKKYKLSCDSLPVTKNTDSARSSPVESSAIVSDQSLKSEDNTMVQAQLEVTVRGDTRLSISMDAVIDGNDEAVVVECGDASFKPVPLVSIPAIKVEVALKPDPQILQDLIHAYLQSGDINRDCAIATFADITKKGFTCEGIMHGIAKTLADISVMKHCDAAGDTTVPFPANDFVMEMLEVVKNRKTSGTSCQDRWEPLMLKTERSLIGLVWTLINSEYTQFARGLSMIQPHLWHLIFVNRQVYKKVTLSRMLIALCRLKGDVEQARMFMYMALHSRLRGLWAVLAAVVGIWPDVFRQQSGCNHVLLSIEFAIMKHLQTNYNTHRQERYSELMQCLEYLYEWKFTPANCLASTIIEEIRTAVFESGDTPFSIEKYFESIRSLELILSYEDWMFVTRTIQNHMFHFLEKYSTMPIDRREAVLIPLLKLFATSLIRQSSAHHWKETCVIKVIEKIHRCFLGFHVIKQIPMPIQEAAVEALLELSTVSYEQVASRLKLWYQFYDSQAISPTLNSRMQAFLSKH